MLKTCFGWEIRKLFFNYTFLSQCLYMTVFVMITVKEVKKMSYYCFWFIWLALCILMDLPIHIVKISMGLLILHKWVNGRSFWIVIYISVPEGCFKVANSADPDEMQQNAAFHMGLPCMSQYPFRSFQYTKG